MEARLLIGITTCRLHESPKLLELTKRCIASVLNQSTSTTHRIVIVDRETSEDVLESLRSEFPALEIIYDVSLLSVDNLARSWNRLCVKALNQNVEHILLLSNDVELEPNVLGPLLKCAEENPLSLVSSPLAFDFSCFLLPLEVYRLLDPFDENLSPLEDWDYYERMKAANIKLVRCPEFRVKHDRSATPGLSGLEKAREDYREKWSDGKHSLP